MDKLDYHEFKKVMMALDYLQAMRAFDKHVPAQIKSTTFIDQLQEEKELLDSFWSYLNPFKDEHIQKHYLSDMLHLLMFNFNKVHKDVAQLLAIMIVNNYK